MPDPLPLSVEQSAKTITKMHPVTRAILEPFNSVILSEAKDLIVPILAG